MKIRSPLALIRDIIEPLSWLIVRMIFRSELVLVRKKKCVFYGSRKFVEVAREAIDWIKEKDQCLYKKICDEKIYFIETVRGYSPWRRINKRFVIDPWMVEGGVEDFAYGVIVFHFHNSAIEASGRAKYRFFIYDNQNLLGLNEALVWLKKHHNNENYIFEIEEIIGR